MECHEKAEYAGPAPHLSQVEPDMLAPTFDVTKRQRAWSGEYRH
jgi:hypothetical protein